MPPARFHVDHDGAGLLQGKQVFRHAWLASAHRFHDVPARCRTVGRQIAQDLIAGPVAKGRDGSFDVGRPRGVVRLRNPGHATILTERQAKSKTRNLDDTLTILDNSLHILRVVVFGALWAATFSGQQC